MSAIGLKAILGPNLDRAFDLAGEMVRDCVFYKTENSAGTGLLTMAGSYERLGVDPFAAADHIRDLVVEAVSAKEED